MAGRSLPVDRFADRIKDSVHSNTVTLIIGQTGCGKSSRVPQMLQEELGGPVMCTQPRRLAVVAIASHVADLTGCELGQDVGFRIGQKSVASRVTRMMFTTSGLLLEELRANGAAALRGYKCLIIDELHERSVESDLLLACLHALMAAGELPTLKLVLMSATANVERYQSYFKLPGDHVALIRLDLTRLTTAIGDWLETVKVVYLDQVVDRLLLGHANSKQHKSLLAQHKTGAMTPALQVTQPMACLVRDLVLHLHASEPDPDAVILVFLPTYRALLLQHTLLTQDTSSTHAAQAAAAQQAAAATAACGGGPLLDVFALHSSVDIDEALEAIQGPRVAGRRRVVLATNCCESSVTLPHVKHVVDSCTTNQVYWDAVACREYARVIWASQSAAQQRAGRTGRTCPGTCYRLVTRPAYNALPKYEASALTLRSLRREVLCLLSSSSKAMADPVTLLGQALDPPEEAVVQDALQYLQLVGAAAPNPKGRVEPTQVGHLLAALPLSLEASLLLVQGGLQGLTREAVLLAALMNTTPFPIVQPFGADAMTHVKQYSSSSTAASNGTPSNSSPFAAGGSGGSSAFTMGFAGKGSSSSSRRSSRGSSTAVDWTVEVEDGGYENGADKVQLFQNTRPCNLYSRPRSTSTPAATAAASSPGDDAPGGLSRAQLLLANMAAYYAWQQQWCDPQHLQGLTAGADGQEQQQQQPKHSSEGEAEWCRQHHLLPVSLRAVSDMLTVVYGVLHRFRPSFVAHATGPPAYFEHKVAHRCRMVEGKAGCFCACEGLNTHSLLQPAVLKQLQALMHEVSCGGTVEADSRLLQTRLPSIHQHSNSSSSSSSNTIPFGSFSFSSRSSSSSEGAFTPGADDTGPVCRYFLGPGGCSRGSACAFRHARPVCRFYLSRAGCAYGSSCRFLHGTDSTSSSSNASDDGSTQQQQQQADAGLWFDWLPDSSSAAASSSSRKGKHGLIKPSTAQQGPVAEAYRQELLSPPDNNSTSSGGGGSGIVLLGEGDFTFTSALAAARQAAGLSCSSITATVLEADVNHLLALYPRTQLPTRMLQLMAADVAIKYGVDATQLLASTATQDIRWGEVAHLVWNFPLATAAEATGVPVPASTLLGESDAANKQLMGAFLLSAARLMICLNPAMKVHVALCNDQYGRWQVEQLARSRFLFLSASRPLDLRSWPGYVPKRGQLDGAFPAERLVVYSFGLALPQTCSQLALRSRLLGLHLQQQQQQQGGGKGGGVWAGRLRRRAGQQQQQQEDVGEEREREGQEEAEEGLGDIGFKVFSGAVISAL